jgi:hypothetical protein
VERDPASERRASLRASDADRERVAEALRQHHVDGRLTAEELGERLDAAYGARTFGELDAVTDDLPAIGPPVRAGAPLAPRPPDPGRSRAKAQFYRLLFTYLSVNLMLVAIWALSGGGHFWPVWVLLGWGIAVAGMAFRAFGPQVDEDEPPPPR